jgi:diadenosine tetraphosphatase ApaH/serine/threonine PP2A family protein phosphatase
MKIAFISDIHANLEALNVVLSDLALEEVDHIVCLGDVVGYGPDPNSCVDLIRDTCGVTVLGNHDQAALGLLSTEYFNEYAKTSTQWTSDALAEGSREFLENLPLSVDFHGLRLVHSSPLNPENWTYVLTLDEARRQFEGFTERLCFIGHSHLPIVLEEEGEGDEKNCQAIRYPSEEPLELLHDRRYIINVGSVGQPRDRDPRAAYVWYDSELDVVCLKRIEYSVEAVQQKILDAGLPSFLASRLAHGM